MTMTPDETRQGAWWRIALLACALIAGSLPFAARAFVGPPGAMVHVRWQSSVDAETRQALEARFRLSDGTALGGSTWGYDLLDPSTDNIRALVTHPAVADTHDIERPRHVIVSGAVRTDRRQRFNAGGSTVVAAADTLAALLGVAAILLAALGASGRANTPDAARLLLAGWFLPVRGGMHTVATLVVRWLSRGIPTIEPSTAAVFRIAFGVALFLFFSARGIDSARLNSLFSPPIDSELYAAVLQWLQAHPAVTDLLTPWLLTMSLAVTIGIGTRQTYTLLVAAAILWGFAAVAADSAHPHGTLILTMIALLPSRWGDALSVDAWLRRRTGSDRSRPASKQYGYSVWVPGFVFGVGFAAAAWAKIAPHGIEWILNGSAKYHFITDSRSAAVDWGLLLAAHPLLAVLASLGAVTIEVAVITAAFTRSQSYRLALGVGALGMLVGFRLFMGVFWPGWWILLLGFLPWQRLDRLNAPPAAVGHIGVPAAGNVTTAQVLLVVCIISQQVIASWFDIERAPMFSSYAMYASTYPSPEAFNALRDPTYHLIVVTDSDRVELSCTPPRQLVDEFHGALQGSAEAAAEVWRAALACRPDLAEARHVTLEQIRPIFDFSELKYTSDAPTIIGTLAARPGAAR